MIFVGFERWKRVTAFMLKKQGIFISFYVEEILLAGNNMEMLEEMKSRLSSIFEMKDMGKRSYVLGDDSLGIV